LATPQWPRAHRSGLIQRLSAGRHDLTWPVLRAARTLQPPSEVGRSEVGKARLRRSGQRCSPSRPPAAARVAPARGSEARVTVSSGPAAGSGFSGRRPAPPLGTAISWGPRAMVLVPGPPPGHLATKSLAAACPRTS